MTEDEAKTKWCPHAVASHTDPRVKVQYADDGTVCLEPVFRHNCIGSACMAWRWSNDRDLADNPKLCRVRNKDGSTTVVSKSTAKARGWEVVADNTGYCGLAGAFQ